MHESTPTPSVSSVIDSIGMGIYQVKELLLAGSIWLADGSELLLIGSVARAVANDWNLSAAQRSSLVSIVFLGVLVGNLLGGPFSDRIGRRRPILISYAAIGLCSILSAFSVGFWSLSFWRFFVGMAFGIGQPASWVYGLEIAPTAWRTFMACIASSLFIAGESYSAWLIWLDDSSMRNLHWRWLLIAGALPSILLTFLAAVFLNESPSWLASRGEEDRAREILSKMRHMNGSLCASLDFRPSRVTTTAKDGSKDLLPHMHIILGPALRYSTFVSCFTCFCMNLVFYGGLYAFPQVLSENVSTGTSPAFALFMGAVWELPSYACTLAFDRVLDRRPTIIVGLFALISFMLMFIHGAIREHEHGPEYWMVHLGYAGYKCFGCIVFQMAYQYAAELYPISCRVAGSGLSIGVGRVGAITSALAYEYSLQCFGTWTMFFQVMAGFLAIDACLVAFLPFETRGKALREFKAESHETDPLCPCLERGKT